ncbi:MULTISPECIES: GGDEF domain-containing protein [Tsukamurella]|uniref:Diguanylate cyclase n=1 Tax=Tsukamurella spumae TaxID=44753 RepID=A0A846WWA9_9ACTN|nr:MULTISPECIES: diguanylate cyclase [Tsukamurella]NKY17437.1 diguanylate cyclase [Tsukamurella spumae]
MSVAPGFARRRAGVPVGALLRIHRDGARVHAENLALICTLGMERPAALLSALCSFAGWGGVALLAIDDWSPAAIPSLFASALGFLWGARFATGRPLTYHGSLAYIAFSNAGLLIALHAAPSTLVALLETIWMLATVCFAYTWHGRVAVAIQYVVIVLCMIITATAAARFDDVRPVVLAISLGTVACAAQLSFLTFAGKERLGRFALTSERLSRLDELTGLLNRRGLTAVAGNRPGTVAVAMIDLDHFKRINDAHGHATGDEVLLLAARRLQTICGANALVARLGGDEFAVVTDHVPTDLGERLFDPADGTPVHASVGVAHGVADSAAALERLLAAADAAMYAAKHAGGRWIAS